MTVKRFIVFAGANYYPSGGWDDYRSHHDTLEEACASTCGEWSHVVDLTIGSVVATRVSKSANWEKVMP